MARPIGPHWTLGAGALACVAAVVVLLPPKPLGWPADRQTASRGSDEKTSLTVAIRETRNRIERRVIEEQLVEEPLQVRFLTAALDDASRPAVRAVASEEGRELEEPLQVRFLTAALDDASRPAVRAVASEEGRELEARIRSAVERAGDSYGVGAPEGALALVFGPNDLLLREAGPSGGGVGWREPWISETPDGGSRCIARSTGADAEEVRERADANGDWTLTRSADPCLLTYWFGRPGPAVDAWYSSLGHTFARTLPGTRPWGPWPRLEREAFGRRSGWGLIDDVAIDRCRTGDLAVCEAGFFGPGAAQGGFDDRFRSPFRGWGDGLLFELLHDVGPERFLAFWTSGEPVPEAFRSALDLEPGVWVRDHVVRAVGPARRGPSPAGAELAGVLSLLVGCGLWGGLRGRRRKAGLGDR